MVAPDCSSGLLAQVFKAYIVGMTTLLDKAMAELRKLPDDAQDAWAYMVLDALSEEDGIYHVSDDERRGIEEGLAQADRGEFVPDNEMAEFWRKLRS